VIAVGKLTGKNLEDCEQGKGGGLKVECTGGRENQKEKAAKRKEAIRPRPIIEKLNGKLLKESQHIGTTHKRRKNQRTRPRVLVEIQRHTKDHGVAPLVPKRTKRMLNPPKNWRFENEGLYTNSGGNVWLLFRFKGKGPRHKVKLGV